MKDRTKYLSFIVNYLCDFMVEVAYWGEVAISINIWNTLSVLISVYTLCNYYVTGLCGVYILLYDVSR